MCVCFHLKVRQNCVFESTKWRKKNEVIVILIWSPSHGGRDEGEGGGVVRSRRNLFSLGPRSKRLLNPSPILPGNST